MISADDIHRTDSLRGLPDHLLELVFGYLGGDRSLGVLAPTCRHLHGLCRIPNLTRALVHMSGSDAVFADCIRTIAAANRHKPSLQQFADAIPVQDAVGVYDRLVASADLSDQAKHDLLRLLVTDVSPTRFAQVVLAPGPAPTKSFAAELLVGLPASVRGPAEPVGVPAPVIDWIAEKAPDLALSGHGHAGLRRAVVQQVRDRYPAPFHCVFPRQAAVAAYLLRRAEAMFMMPSADAPSLNLLSDPDAVLALLRCGIRFDLALFLSSVGLPADCVPQVVPLLLPQPQFGLFHALSLWLTTPGKLRHARALFRIPSFVRQIRTDAAQFVQHLQASLKYNPVDFYSDLARFPVMADIINIPDKVRGQTLLHAAVEDEKFEIVEILVTVPDLNFENRDSDGCSVISCIFEKCPDAIIRSPGFQSVIASLRFPFISYIQSLISERRADLLTKLIDSPFYCNILRQHKSELVHCADYVRNNYEVYTMLSNM